MSDLLTVRIRRTVKGYKLYIKSEFIENYFAELSNGVNDCYRSHNFYSIPNVRARFPLVTVDFDYPSPDSSRNNLNIAPFLAVGLKDGVEFVFDNIYLSEKSAEDILRRMKDFAGLVYSLANDEDEFEINITVNEA